MRVESPIPAPTSPLSGAAVGETGRGLTPGSPASMFAAGAAVGRAAVGPAPAPGSLRGSSPLAPLREMSADEPLSRASSPPSGAAGGGTPLGGIPRRARSFAAARGVGALPAGALPPAAPEGGEGCVDTLAVGGSRDRMRVGLVLYGDLEGSTGGYLYDRRLVACLAERGAEIVVISLPWRTAPWHAGDDLSRRLRRRIAAARLDLLMEDEAAHPSLVLVNRWVRRRLGIPIVAVVHLLRACEPAPRWLRGVRAAVERRYLGSVDGGVFNSEATRAAVGDLLGRPMPGVVAYPGRDHFAGEVSESEVVERARAGGPLRVLSVANVLPGKGLHFALEALLRLPAGSWRWRVAGSLTMDPFVRRPPAAGDRARRGGRSRRAVGDGRSRRDPAAPGGERRDGRALHLRGAGDRLSRSDGLRRAGRRFGRRRCRRDRRARPRGVSGRTR